MRNHPGQLDSRRLNTFNTEAVGLGGLDPRITTRLPTDAKRAARACDPIGLDFVPRRGVRAGVWQGRSCFGSLAVGRSGNRMKRTETQRHREGRRKTRDNQHSFSSKVFWWSVHLCLCGKIPKRDPTEIPAAIIPCCAGARVRAAKPTSRSSIEGLRLWKKCQCRTKIEAVIYSEEIARQERAAIYRELPASVTVVAVSEKL